MMNAVELIEQVREAFPDVECPPHFTDFRHCEECAEHDQTLQSFDPDSIGLDQLGNPGWDPMCFVSPDAFLYYFPALVRLTIHDDGDDSYLDQFLFHVTYEGEKSRFFKHFNKKQREVTLVTLHYIKENMTQRVEAWMLKDELQGAIALWERM